MPLPDMVELIATREFFSAEGHPRFRSLLDSDGIDLVNYMPLSCGHSLNTGVNC